jgi:hypothetical protein
MAQNNNYYHKAIKIQYKGCLYHSILELKFVLLIEDKCSWMREPITIYYNKATLETTNYINEETNKYTPDFLVRKWKENTGHLIEIKPKEFLESKDMVIRSTVINNYLKKHEYDWQYKIITEEDICLNEEKLVHLKKIIAENKNFKAKLGFIERDKKYNNSKQTYFRHIPFLSSGEISSKDYIEYVKKGKLPVSEGEINLVQENMAEYTKGFIEHSTIDLF